MNNGYENIKVFYEKLWNTLDYKKENILEIDFKEYVSSIYDNLLETKYTGHEKFVLKILKITSQELKDLILDTIFSNLYCEFLLMLQNLDEGYFAEKHEVFLTLIEYNKNLKVDVTKNCKERFRRRVQANRLNLIKKIKINSNDKVSFYSPVLIRAFKETLLVQRPNTEIFDVSKFYTDIFYTLMFDSDKEASSEVKKTCRETIKSHRLWKLTENDARFILELVQNIINNDNEGDQIAQLMLIEKLYGLHTIADLWGYEINLHKDDYRYNFACFHFHELSLMRRFGYCLLHQKLIYSLLDNNYMNIKKVVEGYIYPVCTNMLKKTLKTVLKSLGDYDYEKRIDALCRLIVMCEKNREVVFSCSINDKLKTIPIKKLVEFIKGINNFNIIKNSSYDIMLKLLGVINLEDSDDMKKYLKLFSSKAFRKQFYDIKYKDINYKNLFDPSYYDLTFTEKYTVSKVETDKILNQNSKKYKK